MFILVDFYGNEKSFENIADLFNFAKMHGCKIEYKRTCGNIIKYFC